MPRRTRSSDGGVSSDEGAGITIHATAIQGPDGTPMGFPTGTLPNGLPLDPASAAAQGYGLGQNPFAGLQNFPGGAHMAFQAGQTPNMSFPMGPAGPMFPMFNPQQMHAMQFGGFGVDGSAAGNGQTAAGPGQAPTGQAGGTVSNGQQLPIPAQATQQPTQTMGYDPRQAAMFPQSMGFAPQGFDPRMMQFAQQGGFPFMGMGMGMAGFAAPMPGIPSMHAAGGDGGEAMQLPAAESAPVVQAAALAEVGAMDGGGVQPSSMQQMQQHSGQMPPMRLPDQQQVQQQHVQQQVQQQQHLSMHQSMQGAPMQMPQMQADHMQAVPMQAMPMQATPMQPVPMQGMPMQGMTMQVAPKAEGMPEGMSAAAAAAAAAAQGSMQPSMM